MDSTPPASSSIPAPATVVEDADGTPFVAGALVRRLRFKARKPYYGDPFGEPVIALAVKIFTEGSFVELPERGVFVEPSGSGQKLLRRSRRVRVVTPAPLVVDAAGWPFTIGAHVAAFDDSTRRGTVLSIRRHWRHWRSESVRVAWDVGPARECAADELLVTAGRVPPVAYPAPTGEVAPEWIGQQLSRCLHDGRPIARRELDQPEWIHADLKGGARCDLGHDPYATATPQLDDDGHTLTV